MPRLPRVSRKSCPIGRGSSDASKSGTEGVANDATIIVSDMDLVVCTKRTCDVEEPSEQCGESYASEDSYRRCTRGVGRLFGDMRSGVVCVQKWSVGLECGVVHAKHAHPVKVHIGAVKARRNAHPSRRVVRSPKRRVEARYSLLLHPVLFSNMVNASRVDTLVPLFPEHTKSAMMAAIVVPTGKVTKLGSKVLRRCLVWLGDALAIDEHVSQVETCNDAGRGRAYNAMREEKCEEDAVGCTSTEDRCSIA